MEDYIRLDADYTWTELFGIPSDFPLVWSPLPSWTLNSTGDRYRMTYIGSSDWRFGQDVVIAVELKQGGAQGWKRLRDEELRFLTVKTAIGVQRRWLLCPFCSTRSKFLYCSPYTLKIRCRGCHDLAYASSKKDRRLGSALFTLLFKEELSEEVLQSCRTRATDTLFGRSPNHTTRNRRRAQLRNVKIMEDIIERRRRKS